jgi:hypothetical protein
MRLRRIEVALEDLREVMKCVLAERQREQSKNSQ